MTSIKQAADFVLAPSWLITVNENFDVLENHALVVKDGKIIDLLPIETAKEKYQPEPIELEGHALLPGFINTHNHAAMTLLRGFAEDQPLQSWLNDYIWPTEGQWMSAEFVHDGTLIACAEMLKSGTTTFNDMYFFPDQVAEVVQACNMRACLSFPILEFPSAWANKAEEYIDKGLELHDRFRSHELITTAFGPHATYTVNLDHLEKIHTLAEELDSNIHIHLHENSEEVENYRKEHGLSAIEHWAEKGLLSPRVQAVHMTCLSEKEMELVARHNVQVIHCPESNMKLASGIAPVQKLIDAGIRVTLGTDGCASNNDLDMIGEMKSAGLLAKVSTGDAAALSAETLLRMATIEGARMLNLENQCGSLETGKSADCISIDLNRIECSPLFNPVSQIIYSSSRSQVSNVWVSGKQLVKDKNFCSIDEEAVLRIARKWQEKISG